ncbi:HAD family hydrolase [Melioribacter sp. OK-6-Me]|uniref:HAD family hydrolase n=1 Tax=unclassified Melioribacter TaxID=2627329 RepID=UPI003ED92170
MKNFDGIIFDIDGTLADTHELIFDTFNHVIEKYLNKRMSNDEIVALFGPTEDVILKEYFAERYTDARNDYYNYYQKNHKEKAPAYPGIEEILIFLKSRSIPVGIFTGKGRQSSEITLKELGLLDYFDLIITGDDVENHKPDPEGIRLFLSKFNLKEERVLMVGDVANDVKAARDAGVKCALVLWDKFSREKFYNVETDFKFYSVEEFKEFIKHNFD